MEHDDPPPEEDLPLENPNTSSQSPNAPPQRKPRYKECLKNHAVGIGAHAVDGCREFMPAGEDGTMESLKCAACTCHRNFHRKEPDPSSAFTPIQRSHQLVITHHPHGHNNYGTNYSNRSPSGYLHVSPSQQRVAPVVPLALPSNSGGGEDEMEGYYSNPSSSGGGSGGKKRFRTKFTQEQKDKMLNLAMRMDWKIQKQDEEMVALFCHELGINRQVLKVWMHNNKHTLGKKT